MARRTRPEPVRCSRSGIGARRPRTRRLGCRRPRPGDGRAGRRSLMPAPRLDLGEERGRRFLQRAGADSRVPSHAPARAGRGRGEDGRSGGRRGPTAACRAGRRRRAARDRPPRARSRRSCRRAPAGAHARTRSAPPSRGRRAGSTTARRPRPTRPRSWWSCASPKRSASWTIITVAFAHIHAHLDHRRRDEHVQLARLEAGHEVAPLGRLEPAVEAADAEIAQLGPPESLGLLLRRRARARSRTPRSAGRRRTPAAPRAAAASAACTPRTRDPR